MTNDIEAYTNITDDDWVMAEPEREPVMGIGAYDRQVIDMTNVTEWTPDEEAPWYEAGALYAMACRGANVMRRDAFAKSGFHAEDIYPSGNFYSLFKEVERGCPAW